MKKLFVLLLCLLFLVASLAAAGETLRIGALKGPTAMGLVKLVKDFEGREDYAVTFAASPDALLPALVRGELDVACLPANLAAILYNNTGGAVRAVTINTLGVLYIVERGSSVSTLAGLAGRTLYASGKSSTPEYALNHLLLQAGVTGVQVEWKSEHTEALAALLADPDGLAMLPQPFVAVAQERSPDIRVALDLNREWEALGEGSLITGVTVARKELIDQHPELLEKFLLDYGASVKFVNANNALAAALIEEYGIINARAAELALPFCGITLIRGQDMEGLLKPFYQALYGQNPAATGGMLPDEGFYYSP